MVATTGGAVAGGNDWAAIPVIMPINTALTTPQAVGATRVVGIQMPAAWDASTIMTFQASADDVAYSEVQDETGVAIQVTAVAAGKFISFSQNPALLVGCPFIIIRSGTSAAPVNQTAQRTLLLVVNRI